MPDDAVPLTLLLHRAADGDVVARDAAFDAIYAEMKRLAHSRLARGVRDTLLDTTALVHETWLKLARASNLRPESRGQFFAYASRAMRSVLIDALRARRAERRGGDAEHLPIDTALADCLPAQAAEEDVLRVGEVLEALQDAEPRLVQVVEMRWFVGLGEVEIADMLGLSERTVRRDWEKARLLIAAALRR